MKDHIAKILNESTDPDLKNLSAAIKEERDAVTLYTKFMNQSSCKRVKALFKHIIDEENHHADELEKLLKTKQEERKTKNE